MKSWKILVLIMALSGGLVVANLYYCQPLIPLIAGDFDITLDKAGSLSWLTQAGYALGLLLIVPLGDLLEKKGQIVVCTCSASFFMLLAAVAPTFIMLQVCSVLIGIASVVPQLILPFAAILSSDKKRGRAIGIVMSGLLIGILASRSLSGVVGSMAGWRWMFLLGATASFAVGAGIYFLFPKSKSSLSISYKGLMRSVVCYFNTQPALRIASVLNALSFAVVSSFWVAMVFLLSAPPFSFAPWKIGLFGLAGAAGALAAPITGRLWDADNGNRLIFAGLVCELLSFIVFVFTGKSILLLIAGILLLDIGHQIVQIINQIRIYSIMPEANNRFNTVFMTTYFTGGAIGAAFGIALWNAGGWIIYCTGCLILILINLLIFYITKRAV